MDIIMKCDKDNEITIDMWEQVNEYINVYLLLALIGQK